MRVDRRADFRLRHGIKLVQEENRSVGVLAPTALCAQFMADLAAGDQDALRVGNFLVLHDLLEVWLREFGNRRAGIRMTQHALWREHNQWLSPWPPRLPPQHMEVLRCGGRLANLYIFLGGELQKTLQSCTGMFRPLPLITVRKQQYNSRGQIPLIFTGADELIDDHLRAVCKIAELRFPQNERLWEITAEAVFESEAACFRKR